MTQPFNTAAALRDSYRVEAHDTAYLDKRWLSADGSRLKLLPAAEFRCVPHEHLQVWCMRRAIYAVPTTELIEWLRATIAGRSAIELGSGNNDLAWHIRIKGTDSCIQREDDSVREYYRSLGQTTTDPPADIAKLGSLEALTRFSPQVAVASWLTHRHVPGTPSGSVFGPDEMEILRRVQTYIHIGNACVHDVKPLLWQRAHRAHYFPWLVSRARDQSANVIYQWENTEGNSDRITGAPPCR